MEYPNNMLVFKFLGDSLNRAMGKKRRQPKTKKTKYVKWAIESLENRDVPTAGLVAAYNFNQGSGTVLTDVSGNGNNGTITSAIWSTTAHSGDSHSLYCNGTTAIVTVPNSASLQLTTGATLEAWVDPTSLNDTYGDVVYKDS